MFLFWFFFFCLLNAYIFMNRCATQNCKSSPDGHLTIFITFDCLVFLCGFSSHSRIFHSYGDITMTGEVLQSLTYPGHLRPFSHEGSLVCPSYWYTEHPNTMVISEEPWLSLGVWQWSCHYLFLRLMSVAAGIRKPNLPLAGRTL